MKACSTTELGEKAHLNIWDLRQLLKASKIRLRPSLPSLLMWHKLFFAQSADNIFFSYLLWSSFAFADIYLFGIFRFSFSFATFVLQHFV